MKKIALFTLIMFSITIMSACQKEIHNPYSDLAGIKEDLSFEFESSLEEKTSDFKQSTGLIYYVSNDGDDNHNGLSIDAPLQTIGKLNSIKLNPGDQVLFKSGDTFNQTLKVNYSGSDDNPIYYGSYGELDIKPLIKTNFVPAIEMTRASNVVIQGLHLFMEAPDRSKDGGSFRGVIDADYTSLTEKYKNIFIYNNDIQSSGEKSSANGIKLVSVFNYGVTGEHIPDELIVNLNIKYNKVFNVGVTGIEVYSWLADLSYTGANHNLYKRVHIDHNEIYNIGQIGAYYNSVTESTLNHNYVYMTGINHDGLISIGDTGLMSIGASNSEISYNEVYKNEKAGTNVDGMGIDIDWNSVGIRVEYNHTYGNAGSGIGTMANVSSVIANNRIENNRLEGNQKGQIQISDFTARYKAVDSSLYATKNLVVRDNLIINQLEDQYAISVKHLGGDAAWSNNKFIGNHIVNSFTSNKPKYITIDADTHINEFKDNKYYNNNTSYFNVLDQTPQAVLTEGSTALSLGYTNSFDEWKKRDLGATLEAIDEFIPGKVKGLNVTFNNGELSFNWKASSNVWHYNIHLVEFDGVTDYTNILNEAKDTNYKYNAMHKGTYYFVIYPESNVGIYGEAIKIKVVLK